MWISSPQEAYEALCSVISRINVDRLRIGLTIEARCRPVGHPDWRPQVHVSMDIVDRHTHASRRVTIFVPLYVEWRNAARAGYERDLAMAIYRSVRQCVLHEVAECFEFEGRLIDDPHDGYPHEVRPEHDARFPDFRVRF